MSPHILPGTDELSRVLTSRHFSEYLKSESWVLVSCLFADSSCVCVEAVATLAVKSCRDPRAQLLHVIDRLVGMDDMGKSATSPESSMRMGKSQDGRVPVGLGRKISVQLKLFLILLS